LDELHPNSKQPTIWLKTVIPMVSILIVTRLADSTSGYGTDITKRDALVRLPDARRIAVVERVSDASK
jgi:hypothetical protein